MIAAAKICNKLFGKSVGVYGKRYTVNDRVSLGEGKIVSTREVAAPIAGALVVSGGRFFVHAGGWALYSATLFLRVARRISRTSFSAGTRVGGAEDFWLIFTLLGVTMSQKSSAIQIASFVS